MIWGMQMRDNGKTEKLFTDWFQFGRNRSQKEKKNRGIVSVSLLTRFPPGSGIQELFLTLQVFSVFN